MCNGILYEFDINKPIKKTSTVSTKQLYFIGEVSWDNI